MDDPYFDTEYFRHMVEAVLVLPFFFARGFLVWLALAALAGATIAAAMRHKKPQVMTANIRLTCKKNNGF